MHTRKAITEAIRKLGVQTGDLLMVHASLKAIGPVEGGAETVVAALRSAVGPTGTVMGYASWDRSPYEETLNGARLDDKARRTAAVRSRNGRDLPWVRPAESISGSSPGARRSAHPDASMVAVGPLAETLTEPHELGHALGEGSPVERFVRLGGKALLLGAPLNSVTALHYAEAVADIPNKRWVTYEMPMLGRNGEVARKTASEYDSNGILDCFAIEGKPDAVETIANAYVKLGRHREGVVGFAQCYLFDAQDIVTFGVTYLEKHFGATPIVPAHEAAQRSCEPSG